MIEVNIPNWGKFNPRADRTNYSWFRFENGFFMDPKIFEMTHLQKLVFVAILCEASKLSKSSVKISEKLFAVMLGSNEQEISENIQSLANLGVITASFSRQKDGTPPTNGRPTYERTRRTNERTVCEVARVAPPQTEPLSAEGLINLVPEKVRSSWPTLYPDPEFVSREAIRALNWCKINSTKTPRSPRGWARFFSGWLDRGWENYRKTKPSLSALAAGSLRGG